MRPLSPGSSLKLHFIKQTPTTAILYDAAGGLPESARPSALLTPIPFGHYQISMTNPADLTTGQLHGLVAIKQWIEGEREKLYSLDFLFQNDNAMVDKIFVP
jgi:hypothetical protein